MHARYVLRCLVQRVINDPQRRTEDVAQSRCTTARKAVRLAHDIRRAAVLAQLLGESHMVGYAVHDGRVVHQSALERDSGPGGAAHVIVARELLDVVLYVDAVCEGREGGHGV